MLQKLLTVKDVAEILGLKPSTIFKYSMSGRLPIVKINGALRFREDQIQNFIEENTKPALESRVLA